MINTIKKIVLVLGAILCLVIGLYPLYYFISDGSAGLLSTKPASLLTNTFWNVNFYIHIAFGGLALFIGWVQFVSKWRNKYLGFHRQLGKLYVISVLASSVAGIYIGFFATGGLVSSIGFICLGIIWFFTTLFAYLAIRNKKLTLHKKLMIYSYAVCFGAVTLRIWLPILTIVFGDFIIAYQTVAWLAWVPNLAVAYCITRNKH